MKRLAYHDEEWPPLDATGEGPCTEMKIQHSQKQIKIKKKKIREETPHIYFSLKICNSKFFLFEIYINLLKS